MIDQAIATLDISSSQRPIAHTDRGGHYRGGMWIEKLESHHITRSMSCKGNSGDNAACEGFFRRMKTEMYYGQIWAITSQLQDAINQYITFYNNERIKTSLGGVTIKEHRDTLIKHPKNSLNPNDLYAQ